MSGALSDPAHPKGLDPNKEHVAAYWHVFIKTCVDLWISDSVTDGKDWRKSFSNAPPVLRSSIS